jgi:biotin synthase-related radical SAM superfamily protein
MNSSSEHFGNWKKESQIIVLTHSDTKRFRDSKIFREKMYHRVENPRFQLDLVIGGLKEHRRRIDLQLLNYPCVAPTVLDVDEIILLQCRIDDFSFCSNI